MEGDSKCLFQKVQSAKERIYEALREWIVDGTLAPGEKILDSEIAKHFSVSTTPVREAMQLLADQKLIDIFPGRESRVSAIGNVDIPQIYRMLADLHSLALEFAFSKINSGIIAKLQEINNQFAIACAKNDHKQSTALDEEFHDLFVTLADNAFLTDFINILDCHILRIENIYYEKLSDRTDSVEVHNQIIEALKKGDCKAASKAMYTNWMHTLEILEMSDSFLPQK